MKKYTALCIATTFFSGLFPFAPGTVGAFIAIVVLWFLPPLIWWVLVASSLVFYVIGVWASDIAEAEWGKDPGKVNWDEVVGMMISIVALPAKHWITFAAAFFLFRVFDVIKPYPVNRMEKLPGGLGIMTDDVVAGIYTNLVLQIIFRFIYQLPV